MTPAERRKWAEERASSLPFNLDMDSIRMLRKALLEAFSAGRAEGLEEAAAEAEVLHTNKHGAVYFELGKSLGKKIRALGAKERSDG